MSNPGYGGGSRSASAFHTSWQLLGSPASDTLAAPRRSIERAQALVAAAVLPLVEVPEGELPAFEWLEDPHALASPVLRGTAGVRVALRPGELSLFLFDAHSATLKTQPLDHCDPSAVLAWLDRELSSLGVDTKGVKGVAPKGQADGAAQGSWLGSPNRPALGEIERWLCNGDHLLRAVARSTVHASGVRCPSEGLALFTQITHRTRGGEPDRVVVVGLSLGDGVQPVPYFYVRAGLVPPDASKLSASQAVLSAGDVVAHHDPELQAAAVETFFERAITEAHELLHREWRRR